MPPARRKSASPARAASPAPKSQTPKIPKTTRVLRSATPSSGKKASPAKPAAAKKSPKKPAAAGSDFYKSLKIYLGCVGTLGVVVSILVYLRPAAPSGGVCDGVGPSLLLPGSVSTASIKAVWACTKAYQEQNWWFVLAFFETLYIGIKMMGIPATFTLCVLSGALFPMPLCQLVTGFGESIGSSLCYLLSQAFLAPVVEYFFSSKLALMRAKAKEEEEYMLSFNFFLRLTPFMPNWMINLSCPLVGVPLLPFFVGSLFGTQLSLLFLALSGATLRQAGETGFDVNHIKQQLVYMGFLMGVLQCIPIAWVAWQKKYAKKGAKPKGGGAAKKANK